MKLYYSPGACSMSPNIVAHEAGLPLELVKVDLKAKTTERGEDFLKINPKGYVPTLQLEDGSILTEGPAIVQYLADLAPASKLAPENGSLPRYRLQEWLNYITSELHKAMGLLFSPAFTDEFKASQRIAIGARFDYLSKQLATQSYLMGEQFTVADAYLFTVLGWCKWVGMDLSKWPVLVEYSARIADRPAVQSAMQAEGLTKAA